MQDFGIIIACCFQDYLFAKGCCHSIRHFLGDVPICLLVDGTFSTDSLEKIYQVRSIDRTTVKNDVLRQRSFGWGTTKMIAFWESPWQNFLVLDADTNVWGNVLRFADFENFDAVIDDPQCSYSNEDINQYFFDIEGIEKHFPEFDWHKHRTQYFCTGTFFGTRDMFALEEYIEILDFVEKHPDIFKYGEMGFLNFMLCRAADTSKIRLGHANFQILAPDYGKESLANRFPVTQKEPAIADDDAAIIHWCGDKPLMSTSRTYTKPMNFSRRKCLEIERGLTGIPADLYLQWEDWYSTSIKYKNKAQKKLKKLLKQSGNRYRFSG
ncbi:MAG: hypothetical protein J7647_00435 [Cyanobacteria bacterium SBLK]|nr:hypothetical protein [Cyanobacteria bacterium SBLK]